MLVSAKELVLKAYKEKYAVPAFNVHNLENIRACVEAAQELKSPLILACTASTFKFSGIENIVAICKAMSETAKIPIALHMDHHSNIEEIKKGLELGIKSIMIDASHHPFEENIEITKQVVEMCKKYGASVEAELGAIPGVEDDLSIDKIDTQWTDPFSVKTFCDETQVDMIAVAIGTAHGIYHTTPVLNIQRLKEIKEICSTPFVLHGGSGLTVEQVRNCIANGVAKVNIGTELKPPFANTLINFFKKNPNENDPRKFLTPVVEEIKKVVKEKILMCMSDGKC